jgi:drug/metabolite transporter (DMT)-like permease
MCPVRYASLVIGIISAALFGIATPLSKSLLLNLSQFQLAGLLYLGAALGILPFLFAKKGRLERKALDGKNLLRISGAVLFGGCLAPVFLLLGLASAQASSVSLWLNLELAATAVLGFLFFKDHLDSIGWVGVGSALLAGACVTISEGPSGLVPAILVALACVCWGLDNNLTAMIDGLTPQWTTFIKGAVGGVVNFTIGILALPRLPGAATVLAALGLGAISYGGSIVLYIMAAQGIGATRGQILFSSAPFFGLAFSFVLLAEKPAWIQLAAAAILIASIVLMRRTRHTHMHTHEDAVHVHLHRHDDLHHAHAHKNEPTSESHVHAHHHEQVTHEHPHVSDLHHRHDHEKSGRRSRVRRPRPWAWRRMTSLFPGQTHSGRESGRA